MDMSLPQLPPEPTDEPIADLETFAVPGQRRYMLFALPAAAVLFAVAVFGAVSAWPEALIYGLAAGCLGAIVGGAMLAVNQEKRREALALQDYARRPLAALVRATVDVDLSENTRVLIVNHLNSRHPGWSVNLEEADEAWRTLKHAPGGSGGCGGGCNRCN